MANAKIIVLVAACALVCSCCHIYSWEKIPVQGRLTGVVASNVVNVPQTMGSIDSNGVYTAPSGKVFEKGATRDAAAIMIAAQKEMKDLKQIVGHSAVAMGLDVPESLLGNWAADVLKESAEKEFGTALDMFATNTGGIRVSMPKGEVFKDDIVSMFPFSNYLAYVEISGEDLLVQIQHMLEIGFQALSGVEIEVCDGKLASFEIAGSPFDPKKIYKVGTIDFLLDGGDGFSFARNARKMIVSDKKLRDVVLPYVQAKEAEGLLLTSELDGRVKVLNEITE